MPAEIRNGTQEGSGVQVILPPIPDEPRADTKIIFRQPEAFPQLNVKVSTSEDELFLQEHPLTRQLMNLSAGEDKNPWKRINGNSFLPFTYITRLFRARDGHPVNMNLMYQTVNYKLKEWIKAGGKEDLIAYLGPRQKLLKKEGVLDFLRFAEEGYNQRNSKYELSKDGELPALRRSTKTKDYFANRVAGKVPKEDEILVFPMSAVKAGKSESEEKRHGRPRGRKHIGPRGSATESSMRYSGAWLSKPRPAYRKPAEKPRY